jgi:hypothetical protein
MIRKPKAIHEMSWGEALSRLIETKPHEVEPAPGKARPKPRPEPKKKGKTKKRRPA